MHPLESPVIPLMTLTIHCKCYASQNGPQNLCLCRRMTKGRLLLAALIQRHSGDTWWLGALTSWRNRGSEAWQTKTAMGGPTLAPHPLVVHGEGRRSKPELQRVQMVLYPLSPHLLQWTMILVLPHQTGPLRNGMPYTWVNASMTGALVHGMYCTYRELCAC